jgi:hypothetical protein
MPQLLAAIKALRPDLTEYLDSKAGQYERKELGARQVRRLVHSPPARAFASPSLRVEGA